MGHRLFEYFTNDSRIKVVIGVSRPSDKIERLRTQYEKNPKAKIYALDVTDSAAVENLAHILKTQNLIPDILINNAAILGPVKPIWELTAHEFDLTMRTNVSGVQYFLKNFMPLMKDKKGAVIINMSSGWGREIEKNFGAYCTSKFALEGLSQAAAKDAEGSEVTVVALAPGVVETDMLSEAKTGMKGVPLDKWIKTFPDMVFGITKQQSGQQLSWSAA